MRDPEFTWCMYFGGLVAMAIHPGAGAKEHKALTLAECAALADGMLTITEARWPSTQLA